MANQMAEVIDQFPLETALVFLRTLELGVVSSSLLVLHCLYLCVSFAGALTGRQDTILFLACALRLLLFLPRPFFWLRMRRMYREARHLPTPQLVAKRLRKYVAKPLGSEQALLYFFYAWLAALSLWQYLAPTQTPFGTAMGQHLQMNLAVAVLVRVASAAMFIFFQKSDVARGIPAEVLAQYTRSVAYTGAAGEECAICYDVFQRGQEVRTLQCAHFYHAACVDQWLLQRQSKCPLCQRAVGPEEEKEEEKEREEGGARKRFHIF